MASLSGPSVDRLDRAKRLIEHSRDAEAIPLLESIVRESPADSEVRLILAQALTGANRGNEAESHLRFAANDPDWGAMAYGMLGYWYQARGRFQEARSSFEASLRADSCQSLAYYGLGQGNRLGPDDLPIVEQAEKVTKDPAVTPEDGMYLQYFLGKAYADLGKFEASIHAFDRANAAAHQLLLGGKPFDRGRYAQIVDGHLATFNRDFFQKRRSLGSSSRAPIFIVGMMRSGTTLIEQILSSHPEVGAAGELDFWLDEGPSALDLPRRTVDPKRLVSLVGPYLQILSSAGFGKAHVTDKMPQNFQMLGLIHLAFPNAPIVHIRRNPVDTCLSIYTTAYQDSPAFAHDRESIVFAYRQYQRLVAHWRKVLPSHCFLEVDYESLVSDPEPTIRRMLAFCRLDWNEACLQPEQNDRLVTTPSLWQVRQPMYRTAVERWRVYEPWLGAFAKLLEP